MFTFKTLMATVTLVLIASAAKATPATFPCWEGNTAPTVSNNLQSKITEVGEREVSLQYVGEREVSLREVGEREVNLREVGEREISLREVGEREVSLRDLGEREISLREVGEREVGDALYARARVRHLPISSSTNYGGLEAADLVVTQPSM